MASARSSRKDPRESERYTVEDLAELTALTPRTIRSYQTQGLLPAPERHGRVAYYRSSHLERLGEITELKNEGLSLSSINDVLRERDVESRPPASRPRSRSRRDGSLSAPPSPSSTPLSQEAPEGAAKAPLGGPFSGRPAPLGGVATAPVRPPDAGGDPGASPTRRRLVLGVMAVLLLLVVVAGVIFAVINRRDAEADRNRLSRQLSELRGDLSRLDDNQGPPATVVVPGPVQQVPVPVPTTTEQPATRTVVVPTARTPATTPPATTAPATPPTTQSCTVKLLSVCLP